MATEPAKGGRRPSVTATLEAERDELRAHLETVVEQRDDALAKLAATEAGASFVTRIAQAMNEAGEVTKSSTNQQQGYKFASAEAILKAVRGPLFERDIILIPSQPLYKHEDAKTTNGKPIKRTTVSFDFTFMDGRSDRTLVVADWQGIGEDSGDKAIGKAKTSAVKTFIRTTWLLPTEHDDPEKEGGAPAPAQLPRWAAPLGPAVATEQLGLALGDIIGQQNVDVLIGKLVGLADGAVPTLAADMAHMIRRAWDVTHAPAPKPKADPVDAAQVAQDVARQDEAAEPPPSLADAAAAAAALVDKDAGAEPAPEELAPRPEPIAPPATVQNPLELRLKAGKDLPVVPLQIKALRAAGCMCDNPFPTEAEPGDPVCPIVGHGIPNF